MMLELARGISERGIYVDMVLAKAEGAFLKELPKGVRVIDLNSKRVLTSLPKLVRYLRREKPNVMLSTLSHANIIAVWAKMLSRVDTRVIIREASTVSLNLKHQSRLKAIFIKLFIQCFYPQADAVVAVSKGVAEDLTRMFLGLREHVEVVYNPVNMASIIKSSKESLNHKWFNDTSPPVILAVGRLTTAKDYPTLIRAFSIVLQNCDARLLILGEGEERQELQKLIVNLGIEDKVELLGFVQNPYPYMKQCSLYVLSSIREGLPNVLIQALALGASVVSTDCPSGPSEILRNGKVGQLVPPEDINTLAVAISKLLTMQDKPDFSDEIIERFESAKIVDSYLKLFFLSK